MIYSIFPKADTTCYQQYPTKNTGLDEILELEKIVSSSMVAGLYNTRILMNWDLNELSASLDASNINPGKFYLNLYVADINTPETNYDIDFSRMYNAYWSTGIGKSTHNPITKDGASWTYYSGNSTWTNESGPTGSTDLVTTINGTGEDIRADLTALVNNVWSYSDNPGILIQRPPSQEIDGKRYGNIKFFSSNTSTVYRPKLDICYDDHLWSTGSLTALDIDRDYFVYLRNNIETLKIDTTAKFRFEAKEKYPAKTYVTSVTSAANKYLPSSSYYSVVDLKTGETIIPFDTTYTKISCDATSNYANLTLSGLYPNRRYSFIVRVDDAEGFAKYHNLETSFMVVE